MTAPTITIDTLVAAPPETAWRTYVEPEHITQWNFASDDWCCPAASNELRPGGHYVARMEAKDGSMGFDFEATYETVTPGEGFVMTMPDGRKMETRFSPEGTGTRVTTTFEAESENSAEMQRAGWQAILDNYKAHVASL
ncbi:SRPBCC family protein [Pseudoroseicyclus tamaricis]|uniref:Activator of HSP90 ATPase n=1 Tax=Pseudoroseicyclus tamaricis TaxID=2705421 RepID=A0A6B2K1E8_9RHOB|nr:SRPBCC family protein [Pseudoroseicyclus tamaricis]NDV02284.1 activator of HSP90 ATPase [Pseudoroseicyclus tamaricis]